MPHHNRNKRIQHPTAHQLYGYHLGPRIDPGAQAEVFDPLFANPVLLFRGAGRVAGAMIPFQPPQVWHTQLHGVNGLGGNTPTGQMILTPLFSASNTGD